MNYTLAFLTSHGREREAALTLESFERAVTPRPTRTLCHIDGQADLPPFLYGNVGWAVTQSPKQEGFCTATGKLWDEAALCLASEWVFWLEDDFRFVRAIDLIDVAHVLVSEPQVAQMAFMRQPCNSDELKAGSFVKMHPEAYATRGGGDVTWLEHAHHWTTNPSLIRQDVVAANEWPGEPYCEGHFGHRIRQAREGTTFGIWGVGDPWVEHFGVRRGAGY